MECRVSLCSLLILGACDASAPPSGGGGIGTSTGEAPAVETSAGTTEGPVPGGTTGGSGSSESGAPSETTEGPAPVACPPGTLPPGRYPGVTLEHGGRTRTYDLFVPETVDVTQPAALVLNFHGLYGNPGQQALFSEYDAAATEAGVIVAYPAGVSNSWNSGVCCGGARSEDVDDVDFARTVVQHVGLSSCIDDARVFAIGLSNGGHMAHRLACEAADVFAGVASVAGVLNVLECSPARPISVQQFHGTADAIVPYGGYGPGFPAVRELMEGWAARNGCAPVPEVSLEQGDARCETWIGCDAGVEVTLCSVEGGGHCWPGNAACPFGHGTTDVRANGVIAQMLQTQSLPD